MVRSLKIVDVGKSRNNMELTWKILNNFKNNVTNNNLLHTNILNFIVSNENIIQNKIKTL